MKNKVVHEQYQNLSEQERFNAYVALAHWPEDTFLFVGTLLQRAARLFGPNKALICNDEVLTYTELFYKAVAISKLLQSYGVQPRDRICLLVENSLEFYSCYYGAWQTGAVVAPLNTFLHENELEHIVADAKPKVILVSQQLVEKVQKIADTYKCIVLVAQTVHTLQATPQEAENFEVPCLEPDELAALLYTSGTTGVPKGVMLSSRNIITNIIQGMARLSVTDKDRVFGVLPLFHSFAQLACVWGSFFLGGTTIVVPKIERHAIVAALKHQPTLMLGVPALYGLMCLLRTLALDSVRYFICGGDALPDKIRVGFELLYRRRICNGYGLTEACPLIAVNLDDELLVANTVGRPALGITCSFRDEEGKEVALGQTGILWVKGDNIMLGYYHDEQQTRKVLQDGWLDTGDCAYLDSCGRIVISGRQKDLIISKGFNIYPPEIENIIMQHPAVLKVAVLGKPDVDGGEIVIAFVAVREPVANLEQELRKLCVQHLASYKMPKQFIILSDLPMTALAKVDKKSLRKQYFNNH